MAEHAIVKSLGALYLDGENWTLVANVQVTDIGGGFMATALATSPTITPQGGWRPLIEAAIRAMAVTDLERTVETIIFPDCL